MIPVITSTKMDKSAIDLAGVEAGAKIFVPGKDNPFGSLAHPIPVEQTKRDIVCASTRTVEDFLNVDILFSPDRCLSLFAIAKHPPQFLRSGIRFREQQACYQRASLEYFLHCNHDPAESSGNKDH